MDEVKSIDDRRCGSRSMLRLYCRAVTKLVSSFENEADDFERIEYRLNNNVHGKKELGLDSIHSSLIDALSRSCCKKFSHFQFSL